MIRFEIPYRLPSLNEYIDECRGNKYASANSKKQIESDLQWLLKGIKTKISSPVTIKFTWYEQTKRRDKDNVAFAKKYILDALQKSGVLPNDNNRFVLGFSDEFVYGAGDKVMVEIEGIIDDIVKATKEEQQCQTGNKTQ